MNAVEIEEAVTALAEHPFDGEEFPYQFLQAFGNKETTIKRLRSGATNKSDLGGVLQTNNIHIAVAPPSEVTKTLAALRASPSSVISVPATIAGQLVNGLVGPEKSHFPSKEKGSVFP